MKYLFVILFFLSINSFAQEINKLNANGKKQGIWKGVYEESKRPRYEGTFENGKEIGVFKFFDDTKAGSVIATREFNKADNSCHTIFYTQNGFKVSEGKQINKMYEGEWKYYHFESPNIMTIENYKNGKLEGLRKVFYRDNTIAEEAMYKNGLKDGLYKKYAESGIVLEEINYKAGVFEGLSVFRNAKNEIVSKGNYVKGKKEGEWQFLKKGKLVTENMSKKKQRKFVKKPITQEPR
mgnify:CR=1 FL=1|jgi:antitoxin component YwqK of YwqJK toxin-antitoxin module